jgi:hypothetical protein
MFIELRQNWIASPLLRNEEGPEPFISSISSVAMKYVREPEIGWRGHESRLFVQFAGCGVIKGLVSVNGACR